MATAVSHNTQESQSELFSTARAIFVGLLWGAIMLGVFGFWVRSKYEGPGRIYVNVFLLAGVGAIALALWQAFTLWLKKEAPAQKVGTLESQRRIYSFIFLAAGIGLIAFAFVLGVGKKADGAYGFLLNNFAETFGVLLLGLIALGTGYTLGQAAGSHASPIGFLVDKVPMLKMAMLVLGLGSLIGFIALFYNKRTDFIPWFPELVSLLFLSMLCLGCFLWLNSGAFDEFGVRLFVLVFGGAAGLILFVESLTRGYLWRQDILLGGSDAWQGENAWRFWLCAYLLFISLVLMFYSFNLARADIRTSAALRRVMYGYDTIVQGLLLFGILAVLNIVVYAVMPFTYDWTKTRGVYDMAQSTKNLISGLKNEVNIVVMVPQNSFIYKDLRILLDNAQALNNKLKVDYLSPDMDDQKYEDLSEKFPKMRDQGRGILIINGPFPKKLDTTVPHVFISDKKLFEFDQMAARRGEKPKASFKGEGEIVRELKFLVQGQKQRKIYFLQGDGEVDINNQELAERTDMRNDFSQVGVGLLVEQLKKDNYDVAGLSFGIKLKGQTTPNVVYAKAEKDGRKEVPLDCSALIIAGPSKDLSKEALDAIDRYEERGGKLLVFLDIMIDPEMSKLKDINLESFLKRYGVEVSNDIPMRFTQDPREDPRVLFATTPGKSENPLAQQFAGKRLFVKRSGRIVQPAEGQGRFKVEVILQQLFHPQADDRYPILLKDLRGLKDPLGFMAELRGDQQKFQAAIHTKSIPLAVAVTEGDKPRMVIFGDTDFITNRDFAITQRAGSGTNYGLVSSALEWMAERDAIGAPPKESSIVTLDPEVNTSRLVHLPAWLMLLAILLLGVIVWVVRRR